MCKSLREVLHNWPAERQGPHWDRIKSACSWLNRLNLGFLGLDGRPLLPNLEFSVNQRWQKLLESIGDIQLRVDNSHLRTLDFGNVIVGVPKWWPGSRHKPRGLYIREAHKVYKWQHRMLKKRQELGTAIKNDDQLASLKSQGIWLKIGFFLWDLWDFLDVGLLRLLASCLPSRLISKMGNSGIWNYLYIRYLLFVCHWWPRVGRAMFEEEMFQQNGMTDPESLLWDCVVVILLLYNTFQPLADRSVSDRMLS